MVQRVKDTPTGALTTQQQTLAQAKLTNQLLGNVINLLKAQAESPAKLMVTSLLKGKDAITADDILRIRTNLADMWGKSCLEVASSGGFRTEADERLARSAGSVQRMPTLQIDELDPIGRKFIDDMKNLINQYHRDTDGAIPAMPLAKNLTTMIMDR